jgi:hypothetical protein
MRFRYFLLAILSLVLTFNGAGVGNAHAQPVAPQHSHAVPDQHEMHGTDHIDCLGMDHAPATDPVGHHEQHPDEDHSSGNCCKTPLCGCGCVGSNVSVVPVTSDFDMVVEHGSAVPMGAPDYLSPVLNHLIRPPILLTLPAP